MTDARACRGGRCPAEVVLGAVRWPLQFPVSSRDLEAMLAVVGAVTMLVKGQVRTVPANDRQAQRAFSVHRVFGLAA